MIPKTIHYIWFGGKPLPKLAEKCIASWQRYLPDYEIKRWDESNFDIGMIPYTREAAAAKKWAFVSDYARFWILYHYGGIYFDTDVEVIRPMEDILARGAYMGCENYDAAVDNTINPGLGFACEAGSPTLQAIMEEYKGRHFDPDHIDKTIVYYTTEYFCRQGYDAQNSKDIQQVAGFFIYPKEYFCPALLNLWENITPNTRTIHHYAGTWLKPQYRFFHSIYFNGIAKNRRLAPLYLRIKNLFKR